jgi:tetratricopeptide (TPR) repeat protein
LNLNEPNPRPEEPGAKVPEREPARSPQRSQGRWAIRLTPVGVFLPILLVLAVFYVLSTGHTDGGQATSQPLAVTPTSPAVATTLTPETVPASTDQATDSAEAEFDELLIRAGQLARQSRFEEAITIYEGLSQAGKEDASVEVGWAWALILDGSGAQALAHAQRGAELASDNAEALRVLARAYLEIEEVQLALKIAQQATELDPTHAEGHAVLAEAYLLNDQQAEALGHAQEAMALGIDNAEVHRIRAKLYDVVEGNTERALQELQTAAELEPELWSRHHELGILLLRLGDYQATTISLKNALALRAKAETYTALGEAYYWLKEYDRASGFLQQALAMGTRNVRTYALLAAANAEQGACQEAKLFWEQVLDQEPDNRLAAGAKDRCEGQAQQPVAERPEATPETPRPTEPVTEAPPSGWIAFPVWKPERGEYDSYVARADGSDRRLVQQGMHQPAFSPDGRWLALNGERQNYECLFVVRPDGGDLRAITSYVEDSLPWWAPDGVGLAFSSTRHGDRQSRVYIMDQVPPAGQLAEGRSLFSEQRDVQGQFPAWTAQGQIVYTGCEYRGAEVICGLFAISAEPGPQTPRPLTSHPEDTAPAVHGDRIAFMSTRDGNWEIYIMNDDGFGLRRLTFDPAHDGLPTWSPDGKAIAFVSNRDGAWKLWMMDADGSDPRKMFDLGGEGLGPNWHQERISWAP